MRRARRGRSRRRRRRDTSTARSAPIASALRSASTPSPGPSRRPRPRRRRAASFSAAPPRRRCASKAFETRRSPERSSRFVTGSMRRPAAAPAPASRRPRSSSGETLSTVARERGTGRPKGAGYRFGANRSLMTATGRQPELLPPQSRAASPRTASASAAVPPLIFPVVGGATYTDDFGDPRGSGRHEGNDLLAAKRAPAVAVEAGTVEFWTTSASAGCMLYLHGDSGTTYLYIHLNNDLTRAQRQHRRVQAGRLVRAGLKTAPGRGRPADRLRRRLRRRQRDRIRTCTSRCTRRAATPVDPYPYLQKAKQLLFAGRPGHAVHARADGTVVAANDGSLDARRRLAHRVARAASGSRRSTAPSSSRCRRRRSCSTARRPHRRGRAGRRRDGPKAQVVDGARRDHARGAARRAARRSTQKIQLRAS